MTWIEWVWVFNRVFIETSVIKTIHMVEDTTLVQFVESACSSEPVISLARRNSGNVMHGSPYVKNCVGRCSQSHSDDDYRAMFGSSRCTFLRSRAQSRWNSKSPMRWNQSCQCRCWWPTATEWYTEAKTRCWSRRTEKPRRCQVLETIGTWRGQQQYRVRTCWRGVSTFWIGVRGTGERFVPRAHWSCGQTPPSDAGRCRVDICETLVWSRGIIHPAERRDGHCRRAQCSWRAELVFVIVTRRRWRQFLSIELEWLWYGRCRLLKDLIGVGKPPLFENDADENFFDSKTIRSCLRHWDDVVDTSPHKCHRHTAIGEMDNPRSQAHRDAADSVPWHSCWESFAGQTSSLADNHRDQGTGVQWALADKDVQGEAVTKYCCQKKKRW